MFNLLTCVHHVCAYFTQKWNSEDVIERLEVRAVLPVQVYDALPVKGMKRMWRLGLLV